MRFHSKTQGEYDNWSLQELEEKKDNVAQDKKRIQEVAIWSHKEKR